MFGKVGRYIFVPVVNYSKLKLNDVVASKRFFYRSSAFNQEDKLTKKEKKISLSEKMERENIVKKDMLFESMDKRDLKTFQEAIEIYLQRNTKYRRHHVELIYASLKRMAEFGANKDLSTYKMLLDLFPKGPMVAQNTFQRDFQHYPKQQQCAIDLFDKMEEEGVMPDRECGKILVEVFGEYSYAHRKYMRMMYWMPKLKNVSLWPLPAKLPDDNIELAKIALERMTAVDKRTIISVHQTSEIPDFEGEDIWIASAQSPVQIKLLSQLLPHEQLYVNGPFQIYLRTVSLHYFVLRADRQLRTISDSEKPDPDDVSNLPVILSESQMKDDRKFEPTVHEQEDGMILALCLTQTSDAQSLSAWLHFLQKSNEAMLNRSVVFSLTRFPQAEASLVSSKEDAKWEP